MSGRGGLLLLLVPERGAAVLDDSSCPTGFYRFTGLAEALGGLGLILPSLTRILPPLTPLAAAGLTVVMAGAAVSHRAFQGAMEALPNAVIAGLLAFVAFARWRLFPVAARGPAAGSGRSGGEPVSDRADHGWAEGAP